MLMLSPVAAPVYVQPVADVVVVDAVLCKLEALGANEVEEPREHLAQPQGGGVMQLAQLGLVIRYHSLGPGGRGGVC